MAAAWLPARAAEVRFLYLTPADKVYRHEYEVGIEKAAQDLQTWFGAQVGTTFRLHAADLVEWHQTAHPTSWYQTDPGKPAYSALRYWEAALADAFKLSGGRFDDPSNRWVIYLDADILPGQLVGGVAGVALLPANDLRGLSGADLVPINPGDPVRNPGIPRWVGGAGHELGHALGLDHPPGSPGGPADGSLMWTGYANYPATFFTEAHRVALRASPFLTHAGLPLFQARQWTEPAMGTVYPGDSSKVRPTVLVANGSPESRALRIETRVAFQNPWECGVAITSVTAVAAGESLVGEVWARRVASAGDTARLALKLERTTREPDNRELGTFELTGTAWKRIPIRLSAWDRFDAGDLKLVVFAGYGLQTIELSGLRLEREDCRRVSGDLLVEASLQMGNVQMTGAQATAEGRSDAGGGCHTRVDVVVPPTPESGQARPWGVQLVEAWTAPVRAGDRLRVKLRARRAPASVADGLVGFVLQRDAAGNWLESAAGQFEVPNADWAEFTAEWVATLALNADGSSGAQLALNFGARVQTVDIADLTVTNLGPCVAAPGEWLGAMESREANGGRLIKTVQCGGGPGGFSAWRFETAVLPDNEWDCQATVAWRNSVTAKDVIEGSFWVRRLPKYPGPAVVGIQFQRMKWSFTNEPWQVTAAFQRLVDHDEWRQVRFAFEAIEDMATGADNPAQLALNFGFGPQSVELSGLVVTNRRRSTTLATVASDFRSYEGREPGAAWRVAAAADIEKHRKRDHAVAFRYESGAPAAGLRVRARLVRHEFGFGGAVKASTLAPPGDDRVRGLVTNWFNRVVFENDLKWGAWENPASRANTEAALGWLRRAGIPVRGHNLVWPLTRSPAAGYADPAGLREALNGRVTAVAGHPSLRGLLADWDVVNEPTPYERHVPVYRSLAASAANCDAMIEFFQRARAADPQARRVMNEFGVLEAVGGNPARKNRLLETLRCVNSSSPGAVQALGLQAHVTEGSLMPPAVLRETLAALAAETGLPVAITELDFRIQDPALRADYLRDFLTAAFSRPEVTDILLWIWFAGSTEGHAPLVDAAWNPTLLGQVWSNLVHSTWRTDVTVTTDAAGQLSFRGFKGTYDMSVEGMDGRFNLSPAADGGVVVQTVRSPDPQSPVSAAVSIRRDGFLDLRFSGGAVGALYEVEATDSLVKPAWRKIGAGASDLTGGMEVRGLVPEGPARFYRLRRK